MIPQTFAFGDIGKIFLLVGLEILLSADNAIVMAILVRHLPPDQQKRALFYGLAGAFVFRALAIVAATWLIGLWWVQLAGALYLIYLAGKHFFDHHSSERAIAPKKAGFWLTVLYVELTDLAFAIDSVLVAVATEPHPSKVWVVYTGAMVGVIALRWAARAFLVLLKRYPVLEHVAYLLVGWAGVKLLFLGGHTMEEWLGSRWPKGLNIGEMTPLVFWIGVGIICAWGLLRCLQTGPNVDETPEFDTEVEQLAEKNLP